MPIPPAAVELLTVLAPVLNRWGRWYVFGAQAVTAYGVPRMAFVRDTPVMPFVHTATGMPLDIVLAGSGLEDEFLSRARPADVGGTTVPLIDAGDLIIAKVLAGRPQDITDAAGLWRVHGAVLDANRIRATLQLLEQALGQSDLVAAFDKLLR